jgi:uncharacterized protein YegL
MNYCRVCKLVVHDRRICQPGRGCRKPGVASISNPTPVTKLIGESKPSTSPKLINRVSIVLDMSGSMRDLRQPVIDYFKSTVDSLKLESYKNKQSTYLSTILFDSSYPFTFGRETPRLVKNNKQAFIESVDYLDSVYLPNGGTPLATALMEAIRDLDKVPVKADENVSYLVIVITDGEENTSDPNDIRNLPSFIQARNATDKWTFAFAGPAGSKKYIQQLGIHIGNFTEWEQSSKGVQNFTHQTQLANANYMTARSAGASASLNYFTPDFTNVDTKSLLGLQDWNNKFHRFSVTDKDCPGVNQNGKKAVEVADFITARKLTYQISKAFYELTKPEDIQGHKEIALCNLKTGQIYGGLEAKALLKLPTDKTFRVRPGQHGDYKVFVQSTSTNRKLLSGTEVLYRS